MKRSIVATLISLSFAVTLGVTGCLSLQDKFLYYPTQSTLEFVHTHASAKGLALWPTKGPQAVALAPLAPLPSPKAVAVVFHGNAGGSVDRNHYRLGLEGRGWHVVLAEYPGYSWRGGSVGEVSMVADAVEVLEQVHQAHPDLPLYVIGESLGAGVGAAAIKHSRVPVTGVALITPWDTLEATARGHFPAPIVKLLLRDRYDTVANLQDFKGPVALVVAGADTVIPPERGRGTF